MPTSLWRTRAEILGTVFSEIYTFPLPGVTEVTDAEPVVAHFASYEAWADKMGVPFRATIDRARERVNETIQAEGTFSVTCLGGILSLPRSMAVEPAFDRSGTGTHACAPKVDEP